MITNKAYPCYTCDLDYASDLATNAPLGVKARYIKYVKFGVRNSSVRHRGQLVYDRPTTFGTICYYQGKGKVSQFTSPKKWSVAEYQLDGNWLRAVHNLSGLAVAFNFEGRWKPVMRKIDIIPQILQYQLNMVFAAITIADTLYKVAIANQLISVVEVQSESISEIEREIKDTQKVIDDVDSQLRNSIIRNAGMQVKYSLQMEYKQLKSQLIELEEKLDIERSCWVDAMQLAQGELGELLIVKNGKYSVYFNNSLILAVTSKQDVRRITEIFQQHIINAQDEHTNRRAYFLNDRWYEDVAYAS